MSVTPEIQASLHVIRCDEINVKDLLKAAGWWLALLAFYLLLAGQLSGAEIFVGCILALLSTVALTAVRWASGANFELKAAWLKPLARVPWQMLSDSLLVLGANCRRPFRARGSGRFSEREFRPGNNQPLSRTRRALVAAAISVPPNSFVIAIDREGDRLLVHELVPTGNVARDPDWPL